MGATEEETDRRTFSGRALGTPPSKANGSSGALDQVLLLTHDDGFKNCESGGVYR
jgi:hypothetical protein